MDWDLFWLDQGSAICQTEKVQTKWGRCLRALQYIDLFKTIFVTSTSAKEPQNMDNKYHTELGLKRKDDGEEP